MQDPEPCAPPKTAKHDGEEAPALPDVCWSRRLDTPPPPKSVHKMAKPGPIEILGLLPVAWRVGGYVNSERKAGRQPIFDLSGIDLHPPDPGPVAGVPLGGLGGGAIGRGWRGDFNRWSLWPGRYRHGAVIADQFAVRACPSSCGATSEEGGVTTIGGGSGISNKPQAVVLSCPTPAQRKECQRSSLNSWVNSSSSAGAGGSRSSKTQQRASSSSSSWGVDPSKVTYYGLFPRAWTVYEEPLNGLKLTCKQVSPVVPHDYATSSLPCAAFVWVVENTGNVPLDVSLLMSFQNGDGGPEDAAGGHVNRDFSTSPLPSPSSSSSSSSSSSAAAVAGGEGGGVVKGVAMKHRHRTRVVFDPEREGTNAPKVSSSSSARGTSSVGSGAVTLDNNDFNDDGNGASGGGAAADGGGGGGDSSGGSNKSTKAAGSSSSSSSSSSSMPMPLGHVHVDPLTFGVAALEEPGRVKVSTVECFDTSLPGSDKGRRAASVWASFLKHGSVEACAKNGTSSEEAASAAAGTGAMRGGAGAGSAAAEKSSEEEERGGGGGGGGAGGGGSVPGATLGCCVCQQLETPLLPGQARELVFSLSWDCPMVRFGSGTKLPRRYTKYFGRKGDATPQLAKHVLGLWREWEWGIERWQRPVLNQASLPPYYKSLLFNELYFLVDGGTVWTDSNAGVPNPATTTSQQQQQQQQRPALLSAAAPAEAGKLGEAGEGGSSTKEKAEAEAEEVRAAAEAKLVPLFALARRRTTNGSETQGGKGDLGLAAVTAAGGEGGKQEAIGQFLYLEGHEYLMYNTYDVHFYASFALASLWPLLQLSLQRDFAAAVNVDDRGTVRKLLGNGNRAPRKVPGAVPHDLGSPCEKPWRKVNVYNFQDVSKWKDLGPKFVLTVLRDFEASQKKSASFVRDVFLTVAQVMDSTAKFDLDGDGLIENSGFPDQTYDIWSVKGPSAYTGGLWVTALAASVKLANIVLLHSCLDGASGGGGGHGGGEAATNGASGGGLSDSGGGGSGGGSGDSSRGGDGHSRSVEQEARRVVEVYGPMYHKARAAYHELLWNGKYFNYDSSESYQSNSIMSDQCAGMWYARACGLPPTVDPSKARSALRSVFEFNVKRFAHGRRGCVNGSRPDSGKADQSSMQSREVWTGTTYAVAAAMLHELGAEKAEKAAVKKGVTGGGAEDDDAGLDLSSSPSAEGVSLQEAAFGTVRGIWLSGWNELGYWYATPEAWEQSGNYRSLGYMRPLSVWAMQWALDKNNAQEAAGAGGGVEDSGVAAPTSI